MVEQREVQIKKISVKGQRCIVAVRHNEKPGTLLLNFDAPSAHEARRLQIELRKVAAVSFEFREDDRGEDKAP